MLFQKQQKEEEKNGFVVKQKNEMLTLELGVFAPLCIRSRLLGVQAPKVMQ
jgi:hypothetical protein